ncbi:MAG TPA: diacylglycerol kinase family protein [Bacilli bacterium]|nr:diacylglycerol kinase family protein [Bacilli bacterium]
MSLKRLLRSFQYATQGLLYVIKHEQNMQIHLGVGAIVILFSFLLDIPTVHFLIVLLIIGIVFALESVNTAIERTIDLVTEEFHPIAKIAKDVAAGAVLIFSIFAAIIGLWIFIPPLLKLLQ